MNKQTFLQYGFEVVERPNALLITTPQTFISGDPASFWVKQSGDSVLFNDFGATLNALELSLPNPTKALQVLHTHLEKLGSQLVLDGIALTYHTKQTLTQFGIAQYIDLFALLTHYKPKTLSEQHNYAIFDSIFAYLHRTFGEVEKQVCYTGGSGVAYHFDFETKTTLYDFARPKSTTTGALLRKIHDVKGFHNNLQFGIFLDDSDPRQFDKEAQILSSVAHIKPLSLLAA